MSSLGGAVDLLVVSSSPTDTFISGGVYELVTLLCQ